MANTSIAELRRRVLLRRGVVPAKHTKKLLTFEEEPDDYPKTPKMKYIELKYHIRIEKEIFIGSLFDVSKRFRYEVDRSTVLRWRRYIKGIIYTSRGDKSCDKPSYGGEDVMTSCSE